MRVFPSIPAAVVTGAVVMPVFVWGWEAIDRGWHSQSLMLLWGVLAFVIPVLFSTADMRHTAKRWREPGFFINQATRENFQQFYIPAWIRLGVWFLSATASVFLLKAFGVNL